MIRPLLSGLLLAAALTTPAHAWWNDAWTQRTRITLDTTDKGLSLPSAQADVVVPVRLHSGNFDFAAAAADGADLRVVGADDKTPLPFELERFDGVNELAVLWVRVPAVAQGSDKNLVHVYAGNAQAAAETAAKPFASGHALVLHFSESAGPAQDLVAGVRSATTPAREANGLLGGAWKADGQALELPLAGRLELRPDAALTLALWVRPEPGSGPSTLAALGGLRLVRAVDEVELQLDGKKLSAAALPASAWTHVAVSVGAGKATLYVNGKAAAQADALLSPGGATLRLGERFSGLVDEVQLLPVVKDEGWVRLQAAAQGTEGTLVHALREAHGEEGGGEPGYFGILVKNLTVDAWVVIGILGVMFAVAAWVMVSKALHVSRVGKADDAFMARFRDSDATDDLAADASWAASGLWALYQVGQHEIAKRRAKGVTRLTGASLDAIKAAMDATQVRQNHRLNARMVLLTIAISGGPFLGLLGTVVGVMITFAAIAAAGDVNVNAIAPGIAAALLATVAGLGVAIPALFGYNWLASRVKTLSADMQIFVDEYVTRAAERLGAD